MEYALHPFHLLGTEEYALTFELSLSEFPDVSVAVAEILFPEGLKLRVAVVTPFDRFEA